MSESDQFQQYAEGALLWVAQSRTEAEKRPLLELVRTWRKAAIVSAAVVSGTQERAMRRLDEGKEFGTADRARARADELAAQLGHNRSSHENRGRFVRVRDENGEEVYRAPLASLPLELSPRVK